MTIRSKTAPGCMVYPSDLLAKKEFRLATLEERGLFATLLFECWANGSVPEEPEELATYLGLQPDIVKRAWTARVTSFFEIRMIDGEKQIMSPDLEAYRTKIENEREAKSKGGKKGMENRWGGQGQGRREANNGRDSNGDNSVTKSAISHGEGVGEGVGTPAYRDAPTFEEKEEDDRRHRRARHKASEPGPGLDGQWAHDYADAEARGNRGHSATHDRPASAEPSLRRKTSP